MPHVQWPPLKLVTLGTICPLNPSAGRDNHIKFYCCSFRIVCVSIFFFCLHGCLCAMRISWFPGKSEGSKGPPGTGVTVMSCHGGAGKSQVFWKSSRGERGLLLLNPLSHPRISTFNSPLCPIAGNRERFQAFLSIFLQGKTRQEEHKLRCSWRWSLLSACLGPQQQWAAGSQFVASTQSRSAGWHLRWIFKDEVWEWRRWPSRDAWWRLSNGWVEPGPLNSSWKSLCNILYLRVFDVENSKVMAIGVPIWFCYFNYANEMMAIACIFTLANVVP